MNILNKKYRSLISSQRLETSNALLFDAANNFENSQNNNLINNNLFTSKKPVTLLDRATKENMKPEKKFDLRQELGKNLANSFVATPQAKNSLNILSLNNLNSNQKPNAHGNNRDSSNNANNSQNKNVIENALSSNNNNYNNNIPHSGKYSKSFVGKQKNLTSQNNANLLNSNYNNLLVSVGNKINRDGGASGTAVTNNSKNKNKFLKKIPNKSNLSVNSNNNTSNNNKKQIKIDNGNSNSNKFNVKIKEIKDLKENNIHNSSSNKQNTLHKKKSISTGNEDRISLNQLQNNFISSNTNTNSTNAKNVIYNSNGNYYKKIIGLTTCSGNAKDYSQRNSYNNNNNNNYSAKNDENLFFSEHSFAAKLSNSDAKFIALNPRTYASNKEVAANANSNSNYANANFNQLDQQDLYRNAKATNMGKSAFNRINITNNIFNKKGILDTSATYDPDLDSRNETSVERSISINNRNKFYNIHKISLSPLRGIKDNNIITYTGNSNANFNNNSSNIDTFNQHTNTNTNISINNNNNNNSNLKILNNKIIRDSSLSSNNSNNANANYNKNINNFEDNFLANNRNYVINSHNNINNSSYNALGFGSIRMIENSSEVISNYDTANKGSAEKNNSNYYKILLM